VVCAAVVDTPTNVKVECWKAGHLGWVRQSTLGDVQSTSGDVQSALGNIQPTLGNVQSTLGNLQSTFGNIQSSLGNVESSRADIINKISASLTGKNILVYGVNVCFLDHMSRRMMHMAWSVRFSIRIQSWRHLGTLKRCGSQHYPHSIVPVLNGWTRTLPPLTTSKNLDVLVEKEQISKPSWLFTESHSMFPESHWMFSERHWMFTESRWLFPESKETFCSTSC